MPNFIVRLTQGDLVNEITIKVGEKELEILSRKAEILGVDVSDLLRDYVCQTGAFDGSVFAEKKVKKSAKGEDKN
ncbi:MAG: ribbon-helix-helix protein, CopG family [Thiovulaceae bacterium]|nr:ribbon-helix-helix protein, CopG family [Sulfurimonadaceae bacterium]